MSPDGFSNSPNPTSSPGPSISPYTDPSHISAPFPGCFPSSDPAPSSIPDTSPDPASYKRVDPSPGPGSFPVQLILLVLFISSHCPSFSHSPALYIGPPLSPVFLIFYDPAPTYGLAEVFGF